MSKHFNVATFKRRQSGVSTLPTMLLLGGIIIEIAIASAFLTYYFNITNFASRLTAEALAAARAGADDAIIRVVRNKSFYGSYSVEVANGRTAAVTVCNVTCPGLGSGQAKVTSTASVLNKKSRVEAVLTITTDGQVAVNSIAEVPL